MNKEKIKQYNKKYRENNKDLIQERRKEYDRKYREKQKLKEHNQ